MMNFENHRGFKLTYHCPRHDTINPNVRRSRQYFCDMMPVMSTLASVMKVYNPTSTCLPHVDAVIQHFQVSTLSTTVIPLSHCHLSASYARTILQLMGDFLLLLPLLPAPPLLLLVHGVRIISSTRPKRPILGRLRRLLSTSMNLIHLSAAHLQHLDP